MRDRRTMDPEGGPIHLFYDGTCGLCRGAVRFAAARDRSGQLRFAPLGGETFEGLVPPDRRAGLPDSLLVLTSGGRLLARSEAVLHLLRGMGRGWRLGALLLAWVPAGLRDWAYDQVARRRPKGRPCPRTPLAGDARFKP